MKKLKIYNIALSVVLVLLIAIVVYLKVTITAYHKGRHKMEFSVNASDSVPALLVEAKLFTGDGEMLEIYRPDEIKLISRFGQDNDSEGYIRVPERAKITWFSYIDNAFYNADFTLPKAKMEKLIKNRKTFYTDMPVGINLIIKPDNTVEAAVDFNNTIGVYKSESITSTWPWKKDRQTEVIATLAADIIEPVFIKQSKSGFTKIDIQIYNKDYFQTNTYSENKKLLQLVNNRINDTLPPGIPEYLSIGTNIDSTATFKHSFLINFDVNEFTSSYSALKKPINKFELHINMNSKDSLSGVELFNKGQSRKLTNYTVDYSTY